MEREVGEGREVRGRRKGRRGGEMRKGIVIGGMVLSLLMGCNNGVMEELEKKNQFLGSVVNLGNEFLNVFTSFGEMISGSLGLKTDSKKSDVAKYFKKVKATVEGTKIALERIVDNMKAENNPNAENVGTVVKTFIDDKLTKIIKGANTASEAIGDASESLGNVAPAGGSGAGGSAGTKVDELVGAIKDIVDIVLKDKGSADAGDGNKASDGTPRGSDAGEAGKLFGNDSTGAAANSKQAVTDGAKAVVAVTGADILRAIAKEGGDSAKLAKHNDVITNITSGSKVSANAKDAAIAGGIALRAMAKNGKFANGSGGNDIKERINNVSISAVTKALDTLTIAIRKTIDEGLKTVKEAMKISAIDTPATTETKS